MPLNHLDLQVPDVDRARGFFETHFDFRCTYQRGGEIALLEDDAGLCFGLSNLSTVPHPPTLPTFTWASS